MSQLVLLKVGATLLALSGAPVALILGVNFGERLRPFGPAGVRRLVPWATGLVSGYLFATLWFVAPVVSTGDLQPTTTVRVMEGPAQMAGLSTGYRIVSIDSRPMTSWDEVRVAIASTPEGRTLDIGVQRQGQKRRFMVAPVNSRIGVQTIEERRSLSALDAILRIVSMPPQLIGELFSSLGETPQLTGPVGIVVDKTTPAWEPALLRGGYIATMVAALCSLAYFFVALFRRRDAR